MFNSDRIVIVNKLLDRLLKIQVFKLILACIIVLTPMTYI